MSRSTTMTNLCLGLVLLISLTWPARADPPPIGAASLVTPLLPRKQCPPLPPPAEPVITVSSEGALRHGAHTVPPGTTIVIAAGTYAMTIADLTIRNARDHGVSIQGKDRPRLYNLHILDTGDQLVKVNPPGGGSGGGSKGGLLACSRLEYTTMAPDEYTKGISAHRTQGWGVRDNEWHRIRTPSNAPVPTILFWSGSRDTIVERNLLVDCYQGISFGNASHGSGDHHGGIVRNNVIHARLPHDAVIEMVHASGWLVAHNTALLQNPVSGLTWGMEARFRDSQGTFAHNLMNMTIWGDRDGAQGLLTGNLTRAAADWFVDASAGNLHLRVTASEAIDGAAPLAQVTDDMDGDRRPVGPAPDIGPNPGGPRYRRRPRGGAQHGPLRCGRLRPARHRKSAHPLGHRPRQPPAHRLPPPEIQPHRPYHLRTTDHTVTHSCPRKQIILSQSAAQAKNLPLIRAVGLVYPVSELGSLGLGIRHRCPLYRAAAISSRTHASSSTLSAASKPRRASPVPSRQSAQAA
jgi:hypothetical protein